MLPQSYQMPAVILILLSGALTCFAGYRLFRVVLAIYGFILGAMLASSMMGISNTVATIPGIVGVVVTGWLVDATGAYGSAFALAAAVNIVGALVWLAFATGEKIID